jgi:2'-5' RNA ligase
MRLFFALWPDAPAAAALAERARELALRCGGKPVPQDKIHLTLAFLGDLDAGRLPDAMRAPGGLELAGFDMVLDQVGSFRGARVAWAGCRETAHGLADLQSGLVRHLAAAGFPPDERPYAAHVTLARKIALPVARSAMPEIRWRARELALVRSELGKGSYSTLAAWKLG